MEPKAVAPGIWRVAKVPRTGFPLNMYAIAGLEPDGLVLHSATWIDEATADAVAALGPVRGLLMPNHFHNVFVPRYRARFPNAKLYAGTRGIPRLRRKVGTDEIAPAPWPAWRECEGVRTGEGWLLLPGEDGPTLIVCDAFFNVERSPPGFRGSILRALETAPGLSLGKTFVWLALNDRGAYHRWALDLLNRERPRRLLLSHGETIESPDLPEHLIALLEQKLRNRRQTP